MVEHQLHFPVHLTLHLGLFINHRAKGQVVQHTHFSLTLGSFIAEPKVRHWSTRIHFPVHLILDPGLFITSRMSGGAAPTYTCPFTSLLIWLFIATEPRSDGAAPTYAFPFTSLFIRPQSPR